MQIKPGIHDSMVSITGDVNKKRFYDVKGYVNIFFCIQRGFLTSCSHSLLWHVIRLAHGITVVQHCRGKFLIFDTLTTCCCLTLSKHLWETMSWSHAAIQLRLYTSRDTTQAATYLCAPMCTHTDTRQHEESWSLFSLRWAESSRIEKIKDRNRERERIGKV